MRPTFGKRPLVLTILVLSTSLTLFFAAADRPGSQTSFNIEKLEAVENPVPAPSPAPIKEQQQQSHATGSQSCPSRYRSKKRRGGHGVHYDAYMKESCARLLRDEHRVGSTLPWEEGQEPIEESFAGHFPIRSWQQDGHHGETSMYYWYFPAIKPKEEDPPLLLWLQGGPGSSSMIGLFFENGPIRVNENMKLERQSVSWADEYSILFIDQPVGTGYSYVTRLQNSDDSEVTDPESIKQTVHNLDEELQQDQAKEQQFFENLSASPEDQDKNEVRELAYKSAASLQDKIRRQAPLYSNGYVKDERGVVSDLLKFLDQFYLRYPEIRNVDLYLAGESYAGKYVPALAYGIMESNKGRRHRHEDDHIEDDSAAPAGGPDAVASEEFVFPLKGIALGNSLTDPVSQIQIHADHAYYLGLITRDQADKMRFIQDQAVEDAQKGRFLESNHRRLDVFELFKNATGGLNWYDIRKGPIPNDWSRMESFMNLPEVKDAVNVFGPRMEFLKEHGVSNNEIQRVLEGRGKTKYFKDPTVMKTMGCDIMKSATWMVSDLLRQGIRVLAYQGIFDFRDAAAGSTTWIEQLEWSGKEAFQNAERKLWMENGKLAGYVTQVPGLSRVTILGAGHLAPMDQGDHSVAMIRSFIEGSTMKSETMEESSRRSAAHVI